MCRRTDAYGRILAVTIAAPDRPKRYTVSPIAEGKQDPVVYLRAGPDEGQTVLCFPERAGPGKRDLHFDARKKSPGLEEEQARFRVHAPITRARVTKRIVTTADYDAIVLGRAYGQIRSRHSQIRDLAGHPSKRISRSVAMA